MDYYSEKLPASRLMKCYQVAPPRVVQYLNAEIEFVCSRIRREDLVLELGCGYGRVLERLMEATGSVVGIDISHEKLLSAREIFGGNVPPALTGIDAVELGFRDESFDAAIN